MVSRVIAGVGHNYRVDPAQADKLRSVLESLERLDDEAKEIRDAKKDVMANAKAMGFDTKVVREVYKRLKQDRAEREEFEQVVDVYMISLEEQV